MLKGRLRQALLDQAQTGITTTYRELVNRLGLEPPHTIQRVTEALESLMKDDVAAGRPILSAFCVSRMRPGIPARGFFLEAQDLGVFSGDPSGPAARAFHARELQRAFSFYGALREDCLGNRVRRGFRRHARRARMTDPRLTRPFQPSIIASEVKKANAAQGGGLFAAVGRPTVAAKAS